MTEVTELFGELRRLTQGWTRHDLELPREEARELGRRIHQLGGEELMQSAYYFCTSVNPAASVLSAFWEGIGEWRW